MRPNWTLNALAEQLQLPLSAATEVTISGLATLEQAGPGDLCFFANTRYRPQLRQTAAGAVIAPESAVADAPCPVLISANPQLDFVRVAELFDSPEPAQAGVHPSAEVDPTASVDPSAWIGPQVSVGPRSRVEAGAQIGPGCVIGADCVVGPDCQLIARVTLVLRVRLAARVLVHPGAVLGADGFGLVPQAGGWRKVPQLGGVTVGEDCEIGANTTIDRGALGDTVLERDVRLDNQIQIGHNVHIGEHTAMAGCSAVAGSARIGANCLIGGGAGVLGHLQVCDGVTITAMSLVTHSIKSPGEYSSGVPLMDNRSWRRAAVRFKQLDKLLGGKQDKET